MLTLHSFASLKEESFTRVLSFFELRGLAEVACARVLFSACLAFQSNQGSLFLAMD